ncbi:MAG: molybdopterin cofactor-binding domain-containing protein [Bifidobacterium adolescentis]
MRWRPTGSWITALYSEFGDLLTLRGAQFIGAGYNIPSIRGRGRTVCTNHVWGAPFRAYGLAAVILGLRKFDG